MAAEFSPPRRGAPWLWPTVSPTSTLLSTKQRRLLAHIRREWRFREPLSPVAPQRPLALPFLENMGTSPLLRSSSIRRSCGRVPPNLAKLCQLPDSGFLNRRRRGLRSRWADDAGRCPDQSHPPLRPPASQRRRIAKPLRSPRGTFPFLRRSATLTSSPVRDS